MTVLCVGVACLDLIFDVDSYPVEDCKKRSDNLRWHRGGNASNSCTVLSLLGTKCEFLGTIGTKTGSFMVNDFKAHGISLEHAIIHEDCEPVTATCIISTSTGSRTAIFCFGNLPELSLDNFTKLDLSQYSWIHFEGRHIGEISKMMEHAALWKSSQEHACLRVSIELEVAHDTACLLAASASADVVFIGKDFARHNGWHDPQMTLEAMTKYIKPGATVIVPWGEHGAAARGSDGMVVESPAFPPLRVVDTLAAGDTFIAATIFALDQRRSLLDSITLGCRIAGAKVGEYGLSHVKEAYSELSRQGR